MLIIFPSELKDKITYIDGELAATTELTEEEQIVFDDFVKKEKEASIFMFEED